MDGYSRSTCLPNTRLDVIKAITDWIAGESTDQKRVLWLYGVAGSGKSTLSTTIAETLRSLQRLGAFFFFNRDIQERNAATIIRTLAYQLAVFDARIGAEVSRIVESNPIITDMPLEFQFTHLLAAKALHSLEWSGGPIVIVIDALDECGSETDRKILLQVLSKGISTLPSFVRIVIASRQERDIDDVFASHSSVLSYDLNVDSTTAPKDITTFIRYRLDEIRRANKYITFPLDWPGEHEVCILRDRAAGLFIWASTACLYIDGHDPCLRLHELVTQRSVDISSSPFANLDRLYKTGLESAGIWADAQFRSDCCDIFGVILCARTPLSPAMIDSLLDLPRQCLQSVSRLGCVLRWSPTEAVRILHPSFHDYLSTRCHNEPWFIDIEHHNAKLAIHCIELLDKTLRENICGLKLPHPVRGETLPAAVSYSCRFWVDHVCSITRISDDIGEKIFHFLERHLLHWMEALAILKRHGDTIRSLQHLLNWIKVRYLVRILYPHS